MIYHQTQPDGEDKPDVAGLPTLIVGDDNHVHGTSAEPEYKEKIEDTIKENDISDQDTDEMTRKVTKSFRELDFLRYHRCSLLYMALCYDMIDINNLNGVKPVYERIHLTAEEKIRILEKQVSAYCIKEERIFPRSKEYCNYLRGALYALKVGNHAQVKKCERDINNYFEQRKKEPYPDLLAIMKSIEQESWEKEKSRRLQAQIEEDAAKTKKRETFEHGGRTFSRGEYGRIIIK